MKERLDILLVNKKLAPSREKAKTMILEGLVMVNGETEDKPGNLFSEDSVITLKGKPIPYVSRGGLKLEKAIDVFNLFLEGKICMDVGSSTGGFTDCMLQNKAAMVYAVDVGYGQLDWKLRNDPRVICMEKTNIRYIDKEKIKERPDFVSVDVSFISLSKVLGVVYDLLKEGGECVTLIKPQFEAGKEKVGKKGVVRDKTVHLEVIENVMGYGRSIGFVIKGMDFSPVKGPEGNIEYLLYMEKNSNSEAVNSENNEELEYLARETVENSHRSLDKKNG